MKINYDALTEITVKSQEELDMIPLDFKGRIYIEFGTVWNRAIVRNKYHRSVEAWGNSSVEAWENSSVEAWGNAQITDMLSGSRIKITGNARIIYMPKSIEEYCDFYGIKHNKNKGSFFKCVHKRNGKYISDYNNSFEYIIGQKIIPDSFDDEKEETCGHGIHIANMAWALDYGRNWNDLAILEIEAEYDNIVVPKFSNGKIRCKEAIVIREVPLEECGLFGKILAKRRASA